MIVIVTTKQIKGELITRKEQVKCSKRRRRRMDEKIIIMKMMIMIQYKK